MPRPTERLASHPPLRAFASHAHDQHRFDYSDMPQSARLPMITDTDEVNSPGPSTPHGPRLPPRPDQKAPPAATRAHELRPETPSKKFPRMSKPVEIIKRDYDVVVIGSGYGGGVAASRMARGKQSVCVLELGKERWPGEYPETIEKAARELHLTGDFSTKDLGPTPVETGDPTNLYHLILGNGQNAFVANGLGGTSLLNANVFLEADKQTMAMDQWPPEIRGKPDCLEKYYKRARHMLEPQVYPGEVSSLPKLQLLQEQAEVLGYSESFRKVEQTTWFKEDGPNSSGVRMKKSQLTGMDSTGLNDGSKSTTLVTYLADAWNWGAEIFTRCEVRYIKKHPKEGYLIFFAWHGGGRSKFKRALYKDLMWVHAKKMVFLGAGALGTTEILLRSKAHGMDMSDYVGQNMSGNGDLLAFGYNLNRPVNGLARAHPPHSMPVGPTISGIIDRRDVKNPLDGYVIEEGVIPEALTPFMQFMLEMIPGRLRPIGLPLTAKLHKLVASVRSRFWGNYNPQGSLEKTQTYLIMCHDDNQAVLTLKGDRPRLDFENVGRSDHVRALNEELRHITEAFEGTFVNNPFYLLNAQQEITVHPIGGAIMSSTGEPTSGVTNHKGQVLMGDGDQCYKGLVVVDAAVIPTALGANPFATITALAERSVELVGKEFGVKIDYEKKNRELNFSDPPEHPIIRRMSSTSPEEEAVLSAIRENKPALEFTEIMRGYINISDDDTDYEVAEQVAEGQCEEASFFLSVHAYDTQALFHSEEHPARLTGTFTSGALPNSPYMVTGGDFSLFITDHRTPDVKNLTYDFDMVGTDGSIIHFHGEKFLGNSAILSVWDTWKATTTLRVTLRHPSTDKHTEGKVLGKGILVIRPYDLIAELKSLSSSLHTGIQFFSYFAKSLAHAFFAPLDNLQYPMFFPKEKWSARNQPSHIFKVHAKDGVVSRMFTWDPLDTTTRHMELLFIPGAAVDESIFGMPTLEPGEQSAIDYFRRKGYRCFCVVPRVGKTDNAKDNWTTWDARLDITAALDKIEQLRESGAYGKMSSKTYIVAHCAGSVALASGLLSGDIPTASIAGITASQVFMTPQFATFNSWKASIPWATQAYSTLAGSGWYDCASAPTDTLFQLSLNQLLRFYPLPRKDVCNSVVCHRSSFIFGLLWSHQNLNARTHDHLHDFLGGINMKCQQHLIDMGKAGSVLRTDGGGDLLTEENYERIRGIPILFLSGTENCVYDPANTDRSFDILYRALNEEDYHRQPLEGFGHLDSWMGSQCAEKVFPHVNEHLDKVVKRMMERGVNGFARKGSVANGKA